MVEIEMLRWNDRHCYRALSLETELELISEFGLLIRTLCMIKILFISIHLGLSMNVSFLAVTNIINVISVPGCSLRIVVNWMSFNSQMIL